MIRHITRRMWSGQARLSSSVAEPHAGAAVVNKEAWSAWSQKNFFKAIELQKLAIRIKENRGDEDLEQFKEELHMFEDDLRDEVDKLRE